MSFRYKCPHCQYEGSKNNALANSERLWCDMCSESFRVKRRQVKEPISPVPKRKPKSGIAKAFAEIGGFVAEILSADVGGLVMGIGALLGILFGVGLIVLVLAVVVIGPMAAMEQASKNNAKREAKAAAVEAKREDYRDRVYKRTMDDARYQYRHGNREEAEKLLNGLR